MSKEVVATADFLRELRDQRKWLLLGSVDEVAEQVSLLEANGFSVIKADLGPELLEADFRRALELFQREAPHLLEHYRSHMTILGMTPGGDIAP